MTLRDWSVVALAGFCVLVVLCIVAAGEPFVVGAELGAGLRVGLPALVMLVR